MSTESSKKTTSYYLLDAGELTGHNGWVTSIVSTADPAVIVSSSRDKTLIVWQIHGKDDNFGTPNKRLYGHEHFVQDVAVSSDGRFALSGSWDKTLRLWDLETRECSARFIHHRGDVMSVSFSADNRQICSGSRDRSVVLWNTLGQQNFTLCDKASPDWISCVEFSPKQNEKSVDETSENIEDKPLSDKEISIKSAENIVEPLLTTTKPSENISSAATKVENISNTATTTVETKSNTATTTVETKSNTATTLTTKPNYDFLVYASWNGTIKKFNFKKLSVERSFGTHDGAVTALAISPDASLCASGGKDGQVLLWDLNSGQRLRELQIGAPVTGLKFNPSRYWLCGTTETTLIVWDLEEDCTVVSRDFQKSDLKCTTVEWAVDSMTLLCGFTDGVIRALRMSKVSSEAVKEVSSEFVEEDGEIDEEE